MKLTNSKTGGGHLLTNAFTLIELLAVIIILAIVALIATPIILDVVEDARISAGKSESQMIYSGINNYCETIKLKKQMGTLTSEDVDCESKTTFTTEEISKMVNLGNSKVLENTYNGTLTYLKVESNGHIFILENGKFVEEGEIAFTPGECFTYETIGAYVDYFDLNYDACVTYMSNLYPEQPIEDVEKFCSNKIEAIYNFVNDPDYDINELEENNVITPKKYKINYDACLTYMIGFDMTIENAELECKGEGNNFGYTMQDGINNGDLDINDLTLNNVIKEVKDFEIEITGYDNTCGGYDVFIPSVMDGKLVTSIGNSAFSYNQLTSVIIPDSVTTIGDSAFELNQLNSVTIGNSVAIIGIDAFSYNQLTDVTIPNSVTTIGNYAFKDNQLTDVTMQNSVTTIGIAAFDNNKLVSLDLSNLTNIQSISYDAFKCNLITQETFIGINEYNYDYFIFGCPVA